MGTSKKLKFLEVPYSRAVKATFDVASCLYIIIMLRASFLIILNPIGRFCLNPATFKIDFRVSENFLLDF